MASIPKKDSQKHPFLVKLNYPDEKSQFQTRPWQIGVLREGRRRPRGQAQRTAGEERSVRERETLGSVGGARPGERSTPAAAAADPGRHATRATAIREMTFY